MSLEITIDDGSTGRTTVATTGRLDAHEAPRVADALAGLLAAGVHDIALDLSGTIFIDSTGLAELVRAMKNARSNGGDLVLVEPSEPVRVILELTAFDKAFNVEDGEPVAQAADSAGPAAS